MEKAERKTLIDQYITLCQRHNMTRAAETKEATVFFEELKESLD